MRSARAFPARSDQLSTIRAWVRDALSARIPESTVADAVAIVSELAANSAEHSGSPCVHIALVIQHRRLRVTVADYGPPASNPAARDGTGLVERGRGLQVVRALARRCCSRVGPTGVTVIAVLTLPRRPT